MANYRYTAEVYDFGNDVYGNPTAHWCLWDHKAGKIVARSKSRRQQCGYVDSRDEGPHHALYELTGIWYERARVKGSRPGRMTIKYRKPRGRGVSA